MRKERLAARRIRRKAPQSYLLEGLESRVLLSAALPMAGQQELVVAGSGDFLPGNWATAVTLAVPATASALMPVTVTATVAANNGDAGTITPTGTVDFYDNAGTSTTGTLLGSAVLADGTVTLNVSGFTAGAHNLWVVYDGDANFAGGTLTGTVPVAVSKSVPTVTLQVQGGGTGEVEVTATQYFVVTVTPAPVVRAGGMGTVSLWNAQTQVGATDVVNGTATLAVANMGLGEFQLRAEYSGNGDLLKTSGYLSLAIVKATPTVTIQPMTAGATTLTVTIASNAGYAPGGTVTLMENDQAVTAAAVSNYAAQFDVGKLPMGTHTFTAVYNGDPLFAAATSAALPVAVPLTVTAELTATRYSVQPNETIQLRATASPAVAGTMAFYAGNTKLGQVAVSDGTASFSYTVTTPGLQQFSARFQAAGANAQATGTTVVGVYQPTVIDMMALYTTEELAAAGSVSQIMTRVNQQVADTNKAFANSLIPVSLRLAALMPANYSESADMEVDWEHLSDPSDGVMDNVTALRKQVGADLVVLLRATSMLDWTYETMGLGSMLNRTVYNSGEQDMVAFIVVSEDAGLEEYVLTHEIGHTLGIAHAVDDPGGAGLTPAAHGYRFRGTDGVLYHDVMAYYPGTPVLYFSNPNVSYKGVPTGNAQSANSASVIATTAPAVAAYRKAVPFGKITSADANTLTGWALDTKALGSGLPVTITIDGVTAGSVVADEGRSDLLGQYGAGNHGFTFAMPHLAAGLHEVKVYTVDAASGALALVGTTKVNANHLALTVPGTVTAGRLIGSLRVTVADDGGRTATGYQGSVTLAIAKGPAGATIGGPITAAVVNGVATFNNVTFETAGTYTLQASDGMIAGTSGKLIVTPDAASGHLQILSGAVSETAMGTVLAPVVMGICDDFGNVIATERSTVTLTAAGPAGAVFKGTTSAVTVNGKATFSGWTLLTAGDYTLVATPSAGSTMAVTTAVQWPLTVTLPVTRSSLPKLSAGGYALGTSITLASTLVSSWSQAGPFTGAAMLALEGGTTIAGSLTTTGAAKFIVSGLSAGTYTGAVVYAGDGNHTAATGSAFTFTVNKVTSTAALAVSKTATVYGEAIALTASVGATGAPPAGLARTGTVVFRDGTTALGTVTLDGNSAAWTVTLPAVGTHAYSAVYSGDDSFKGVTSTAKSVAVKKDRVQVTLTLPAGVRLPGEAFTLQALVAAAAPGTALPTGVVTFKDGAKVLGTATVDGTGLATFEGALWTAGTHTVTASYAGDASCNTGVSAGVKQAVGKATTTVVLQGGSDAVRAGQTVTLTATVAAAAPATVVPTGTVKFMEGAKVLGTAKIIAGVASWNWKVTVSSGMHLVTASYVGDGQDLGSVSEGVQVTVG
jgi:large repetitive protein